MSAGRRDLFAWIVLAGIAVAVGMRLSNTLLYPLGYGYDSIQNWRYIERLTESWELPAPDADWATSHPPLFYYLGAAVARGVDQPEPAFAIVAIRLVGTAAGLLTAWLAFVLVRRTDPEDRRRAWLAALLVLFLPVHVVMSAMLNEEILASALLSLAAVGAALELERPEPSRSVLRAAGVGATAGLAWLTKLSGVLVVLAAASAFLWDGARSGQARRPLERTGAFVLVAVLLGGWYYARNLVAYGYLYPQNLPIHSRMMTMPPGERSVGDYLRVPLATWTDPQAMNPDLLRSVWGTTYAGLWFDAHRHFLPRDVDAVTRAGTWILLLALLPSAAFALGILRGARRALRGSGSDSVLLLLVGLSVAGYVLFTWRNPWFAAVKGSYLLGLAVPFAFYASEVLAGWTRAAAPVAGVVWATLAALAVSVGVVFTFGEHLWSFEHLAFPGMRWVPVLPP